MPSPLPGEEAARGSQDPGAERPHEQRFSGHRCGVCMKNKNQLHMCFLGLQKEHNCIQKILETADTQSITPPPHFLQACTHTHPRLHIQVLSWLIAGL